MLLFCGSFVLDDNIDFVLQNYDVLESHDLYCGQVLTCLWLGTWLVTCYEQKSSVHDSCSCKHGGHQNIVSRTIDERNMSHELKGSATIGSGALNHVRFARTERLEALWRGAVWTLIQLCIGVSKFNCNVSISFFVVTNSVYS